MLVPCHLPNYIKKGGCPARGTHDFQLLYSMTHLLGLTSDDGTDNRAQNVKDTAMNYQSCSRLAGEYSVQMRRDQVKVQS